MLLFFEDPGVLVRGERGGLTGQLHMVSSRDTDSIVHMESERGIAFITLLG